MGLNITAYHQLNKIDTLFDDDGLPIDNATGKPLAINYFQAELNSNFPGRADEIDDGAVYTYSNSMEFSAGTYRNYNNWRDDLAKLAGYSLGSRDDHGLDRKSYRVACLNSEQGPFSELINFSDCGGVIGTAVSAKLAKDFANFNQRAQSFSEDTYFYAKYIQWHTAFELASDNGAVDFH
ncbi:hypothetical protein [Limnobaculum parvum]|uniref:Uncharacterized protein n=1 Tax=Limnobaculum parvum TaxID=2172103 RepID=A0A2Y9TTX0_9GAMM|nr:hypothetical protein [Limnobaculum parvum]AWH87137.1 hypothetical protein HYN51_00370 [Limnobaculum parvum]